MIPYRIVIRHGRTETEEVAEGELSDELWQLLVAFREEANRLATCEWVAADLPGTYRIHFESGAMRVELIDAPPVSAMREVLHCLRSFVLQSEGLYYPKVSGRLYKALRDPILRGLLGRNRHMYDGKDMRELFTITKNQLDLTSERALDLWMDAFEYHPHGKQSERKLRFLELHGGPPDDLAVAIFRDMLRGKVLAILNLAGFVRGIEKSPTFRAHMDTQAKSQAV
jgi:hypothetical protein